MKIIRYVLASFFAGMYIFVALPRYLAEINWNQPYDYIAQLIAVLLVSLIIYRFCRWLIKS